VRNDDVDVPQTDLEMPMPAMPMPAEAMPMPAEAMPMPAEATEEPTKEQDGDELAGRLDGIEAALLRVCDELAATHERAAARERVIDRLYDENQRLRTGERQLLLRPVLVDLQRLRNDLLRQAAALPAEVTTEAMARLMRSFADSVELTLERGGIRVVHPEVATPFDPDLHRAAEVVLADTPERDKTVAGVLADGYLDVTTGRATVPAVVRVHRWTPPSDV
jgi:molecular chaperone GrpE (heat shock protein)